MAMSKLCIYCGERVATTKDHVPPQCLFPKPLPPNMITVPSCEICNKKYGKDDERIRNLLTSLDVTENNPGIINDISLRRDRSLERKQGKSNLEHMISSMKLVEVRTDEGIILGNSLAFNLDQDLMDNFFERMTRGLIHYERGLEAIKGGFKWHMSLTKEQFKSLSYSNKKFFMSGKLNIIGENIFKYVVYAKPGSSSSIFLLNFFEGIEFISMFTEKQEIQ